MSKIYYTYTAYPNCAEATEYSKSRTSSSLACGILGAIITFVTLYSFSSVRNSFYDSYNLWEIIGYMGLCFVVAIFDFYAFIWRHHQTKCELEIIFTKTAYRQKFHYEDADYSKEEKRIAKQAARARIKELETSYKHQVRKSAVIYFSVVTGLLFLLFFMPAMMHCAIH